MKSRLFDIGPGKQGLLVQAKSVLVQDSKTKKPNDFKGWSRWS
jgi:hypothetical protein